jgi:hypothetical protein
MNLSALTATEVMRICAPETELEKRLFDICKELEGEADDAKDNEKQAKNELEDYECDCYDNSDEIKRAIDLIDSGKVNDGVNILKRI